MRVRLCVRDEIWGMRATQFTYYRLQRIFSIERERLVLAKYDRFLCPSGVFDSKLEDDCDEISD